MKPIKDQPTPLTGPDAEVPKKPCCKLVSVVHWSESKQGNKSQKTTQQYLKVAKVNATKKTGKAYHHGFKKTDITQQYIQYAYNISNGDIDFILTLNSEMWDWNVKWQSQVPLAKWWYEKSRWLCQVHYYDHKEVYDNLPLSRVMESKFLNDWKFQLDVCYDLYKKWVRFFWFDDRYIRSWWRIEIDWKRY